MNTLKIRKIIKKCIPIAMKVRIIGSTPLDDSVQKNAPKAYIFLAANYGNLGDVLITRAQTQFLAEILPAYDIIKVYPSQVIKNLPRILRESDDRTIFTLIGGGNIGDKYKESEYLREYILKRVGDRKIISFPQTPALIGSDNSFFIKKKHLYDKANITIAARDKKSFDLFSSFYKKAKIILTPDIALYLNYEHGKKHKKILLCLRDDTEKVLDAPEISDEVQNKYDIVYHDTQIASNNLSEKEQRLFLDDIIEDFRTSDLVVTDRLHGMILAKITGTPFIAYDNYNKKISRVYDTWLCRHDGIVFSDQASVIDEAMINRVMNNYVCKKTSKRYFEPLRDSVLQ